MTHQRLARVIFALLLALVLLSPGAGSAEIIPRIAHLTPGGGSQVISPIPVSAEIQPDASGLVRVELLDGRGQAIARQLLRLDASENGQPQSFTTELPFEIATEAEDALLTLSLLDSLFRPIALRSAQITLLSDGEAQIEPTQGEEPWVTLVHPEPMDIFTGGQVMVAGTVTPINDNPVNLDLIDDTGRVIGSVQIRVQAPGQTFDFETTLFYYYIKTFNNARLVIRQNNPDFNTTIILDSLLIGVSP